MSKLPQLLRGVRWTGSSAVVRAVAGIIRLAVLSRLLAATEFGIMATALIVLSVGQVLAELGFSVAIISNRKAPISAYSSLYTFSILSSWIIYLAIVLLTYPLAEFFAEPRLLHVFPASALVIPIYGFATQHRAILLKRLAFSFLETVDIAASMVGLVVAIAAALSGWGVYALISAYLAEAIFTAGCLGFRGFREVKYRWRLHWQEVRPFFHVGVYSAGGQLLNTLGQQLDVVFIGRALGMDALGTFNLLKGLSIRPVRLLNPILNKLTGPVLATQQADLPVLRANFLRILRVVGAILLPLYTLLALAAPVAIRALLGEVYVPYAGVFACLCMYYSMRGMINPIGSLVVATGRTRREFTYNLLQIGVLPIVLWLVVDFGLTHIVEALVYYSLFLLGAAYWVVIRPLLRLSLMRYIRSFLPGIIGSALVYLSYTLVTFAIPSEGILPELAKLMTSALGPLAYWIGWGHQIDAPLYRQLRNSFKK